MQYKASSPEEYIKLLPEERKEPVKKLRQIILDNLPKGMEEQMSYGIQVEASRFQVWLLLPPCKRDAST